MALISLLVGLISPLSIVSRVFLPIPLLGIILAFFALRKIATSEGQLAGRWLAILGLVLCTASSVAAVTRTAVTQSVRMSQGEKFGHAWLALLTAGDTEPAFKATYDGVRPLPPSEPGEPPPTTTPYEDFLSSALIKQIIAAGKEAKIELVNTSAYVEHGPSSFYVEQVFRIVPNGGDTANPIGVKLISQHSKVGGGQLFRWLVMRYEHSDLP